MWSHFTFFPIGPLFFVCFVRESSERNLDETIQHERKARLQLTRWPRPALSHSLSLCTHPPFQSREREDRLLLLLQDEEGSSEPLSLSLSALSILCRMCVVVVEPRHPVTLTRHATLNTPICYTIPPRKQLQQNIIEKGKTKNRKDFVSLTPCCVLLSQEKDEKAKKSSTSTVNHRILRFMAFPASHPSSPPDTKYEIHFFSSFLLYHKKNV